MKILIIGHSRSGSSNLIKALLRVQHGYGYDEPFNKREYFNYPTIDFSKDCVIKTLI